MTRSARVTVVTADPLADRLVELLQSVDLRHDPGQVGRIQQRKLRIVNEEIALKLIAVTADAAENLELARTVGELGRSRTGQARRLGCWSARQRPARTARKRPE